MSEGNRHSGRRISRTTSLDFPVFPKDAFDKTHTFKYQSITMSLFFSTKFFISAQQISTVKQAIVVFPKSIIVFRRIVYSKEPQNNQPAGNGTAGRCPF